MGMFMCRAAACLVAFGAAGAHAYNGDPDPTFGIGGTGYATRAFDLGGNDADTAQAVLVQTNGRIVLVGRAVDSATSNRIALAAFRQDGSIDTAFGSNGITSFPLASGTYSAAYPYVNAAALDAQGRILVTGDTGSDACSYVARSSADGALDTSFGVGGFYVVCPTSGHSIRFMDVIADAAGRPVVAGTYATTSGDLVTASNYLAARLTTAGTLDPAFNGGAIYTKSIGLVANSKDRAGAVALDRLGRIYVGGAAETSSNRDAEVVLRLSAAGAADTSCGGTGWANLGAAANAGFVATGMALRDAHHLVIAGTWFDMGDPTKTGVAHAEMDTDTCQSVYIGLTIPATAATAGRVAAASDGAVYVSYSQRMSNTAGSAWYASILTLYDPLPWSDGFGGIYPNQSTYGTGLALVAGKPLQAIQAQYNGQDYDFAVARFQNDRIFYANFERDGAKATP